MSCFVDQARARTVDRRNPGAGLLDNADGACELVRFPDIVLVAKGVIVAGKTLPAGGGQEICRRATPRAIDDLDLTGREGVLEGPQDG
jgi:hypothetical protein